MIYSIVVVKEPRIPVTYGAFASSIEFGECLNVHDVWRKFSRAWRIPPNYRAFIKTVEVPPLTPLWHGDNVEFIRGR